jgi:protein disulfide-isomerase
MKIIKNILPILFAVVFLSTNGCSLHAKGKSLKWYDNLEKAEQVAQKENRPIMVDFTGSDWCVWCKRLNAEVFSKDEFINYANNNLVLVKIDFPQNLEQTAATKYYNQKLAQKFGVQGFPTVILLKSNGEPIAQTGYQQGGAANYVEHIKSLL